MQLEKEKYKFDYEDIQSELDKALGQATRIQKEKDTMKLEADHYQEKCEKAQVSFPIRNRKLSRFIYFCKPYSTHFHLNIFVQFPYI